MISSTPQIMQKLEKWLFDEKIASPLELMRRAAGQMYLHIKARLCSPDSVVILCGKGNNAGDGYELARLMLKDGVNVLCAAVFNVPPTVEPAYTCYKAYVDEGGTVISDLRKITQKLCAASVIADAVFGIGFRSSIEKDSELYSLLDEANRSRAFRVALDVPSGVHSDDGSVGSIAFVADLTVTVTAPKIGMFSYPARLYCGTVITADIGISPRLLEKYKAENLGFVPDDDYITRTLPERSEVCNKGDFGKLLCLCGSTHMTGAAVLSVGAALRTGAGLVTLASEAKVLDCVRLAYPEPIYKTIAWENAKTLEDLCDNLPVYTAILAGCGLDRSPERVGLLERIIKNTDAQLVLDADGINMIASHIEWLREAKKTPILTPHPGEFARLTGLEVEYINDNRIKCAVEFAAKHACILVLKGAGTIVAAPNGRFAVNRTGNAGLAKGGSGDVLAGLIAGLAAQPAVDAFDAAVCGVYLHGKAADVLKSRSSAYGLLPSEIAEEVGRMLP